VCTGEQREIQKIIHSFSGRCTGKWWRTKQTGVPGNDGDIRPAHRKIVDVFHLFITLFLFSEESPTERPTGKAPPKVHTIIPPAAEKKSTTFLIISSEETKEANTHNLGHDVILNIANPSANFTQPRVVSLTQDQISAVLKSLNATPSGTAESKYVDAATQFSPQQTTILPTLSRPIQAVPFSAVPTHVESVKRTLEVEYPGDNSVELCSKKVRIDDTPVSENVVIEPVAPPTIFVRSPDIEVHYLDDSNFIQDSLLSNVEVVVSNSEEVLTIEASPVVSLNVEVESSDAPLSGCDAPESVAIEDAPVHRAVLRISPDLADGSNSQDAEVARINMPVLERAKLISKGRPSPLRVLHLEPEFCASPPMHQLPTCPRLPSNSPSPKLPHRVTDKDLDLASPLQVPHNAQKDKPVLPTEIESYNFPVISEEKLEEVTLPAIPRTLYNDIVMPQPLSPSNFSPSPREGRSNSVFSFASSAVNTPDFDVQKLAQSCVPSPVVDERSTLIAPGLAQITPMIPIHVAMTPKTVLPSTIQHQYSTPIQNLALANSLKMSYHSNISNAMTMSPAQSIGTPLAFTPITTIATPGTFFRSTPGTLYPVHMNVTPSDKLSEGISATLLPSGGYILPFKKDLIPVRKLSMPPKDASTS
jgi:hypothetical protein